MIILEGAIKKVQKTTVIADYDDEAQEESIFDEGITNIKIKKNIKTRKNFPETWIFESFLDFR